MSLNHPPLPTPRPSLVGSIILAAMLMAASVAAAAPLSASPAVAARPAAQATATVSLPSPVGTVEVPPGPGTEVAPAPVPTGPAPPGVQTDVAEATPITVGPSDVGSEPQAEQPPAPEGAAPQAGGFPWLPAILGGLVLLAALGFLLLRQRGTTVVRAPPREPAPAAPAEPTTAMTSTTSTTSAMSAAAPTPTVGGEMVHPGAAATTAAPVAAAAPAGAPSALECPNCGTANGPDENFCRECGQDLRPLRTQEMAASQPVAAVADDTPYLETLDRTDEQLEYVLARDRILIGSAPGNDIVIDSAFAGWRTVSPVHAELRREQDGFALIDRDSDAGTYVNEMRTGENLLSDGDLVRLGDVRFVFRVPGPE